MFVLKWYTTITLCSKIHAKLNFPASCTGISAYTLRDEKACCSFLQSERILNVRHKTSVLRQSHAGIFKFCISSSQSAVSIFYDCNKIDCYIDEKLLDRRFSLLILRVRPRNMKMTHSPLTRTMNNVNKFNSAVYLHRNLM